MQIIHAGPHGNTAVQYRRTFADQLNHGDPSQNFGVDLSHHARFLDRCRRAALGGGRDHQGQAGLHDGKHLVGRIGDQLKRAFENAGNKGNNRVIAQRRFATGNDFRHANHVVQAFQACQTGLDMLGNVVQTGEEFIDVMVGLVDFRVLDIDRSDKEVEMFQMFA